MPGLRSIHYAEMERAKAGERARRLREYGNGDHHEGLPGKSGDCKCYLETYNDIVGTSRPPPATDSRSDTGHRRAKMAGHPRYHLGKACRRGRYLP